MRKRIEKKRKGKFCPYVCIRLWFNLDKTKEAKLSNNNNNNNKEEEA